MLRIFLALMLVASSPLANCEELDPFFSEARNASAAALGQTNFVVGRMALECHQQLQRPESWVKEFVVAWQKRNGKYYNATRAYMITLLKETERIKGKEASALVAGNYSSAVRRDGEGAVAGFFKKGQRLEVCTRVTGLIEEGAFDVTPAHPFFAELQELARE